MIHYQRIHLTESINESMGCVYGPTSTGRSLNPAVEDKRVPRAPAGTFVPPSSVGSRHDGLYLYQKGLLDQPIDDKQRVRRIEVALE